LCPLLFCSVDAIDRVYQCCTTVEPQLIAFMNQLLVVQCIRPKTFLEMEVTENNTEETCDSSARVDLSLWLLLLLLLNFFAFASHCTRRISRHVRHRHHHAGLGGARPHGRRSRTTGRLADGQRNSHVQRRHGAHWNDEQKQRRRLDHVAHPRHPVQPDVAD